jgi:hypothetical protein
MIRPAALAILLVAGGGAAAARLEPDGRTVWRDDDPAFGGFSGIEVTDEGAALLAIGDRGAWATAAMEREVGRLVAVRTTGLGRLKAISGAPLAGDDVDAEGLALAPDGAAWVSFEAFHRIRRYPDIDGPAQEIPGHPDFPRLQRNSGLEALAIDADGAVWAIPERSGAWERPFPVYRLRDGVWDTTVRVPRSGTFLVAGADFGPDGQLYLLERDFTWFGGFATRVRRFAVGTAGLGPGETLLETGFGTPDNFEGISVWRDGAGDTRVTLIADDNFFGMQSTVVAEYLVVEG